MKRILASLVIVPTSIFFTLALSGVLDRSIANIMYSQFTHAPDLSRERFVISTVVGVLTMGWVLLLIAVEAVSFFRPSLRKSRSLKHLRFAPIAAITLGFILVPIFDAALIQYSQMQIRAYIFNNDTAIGEPEMRLHSDYRHWCGNGFIASISYYYLNVSEEGLEDERPEVRARSLLMVHRTADTIFNGTDREHFNDVLTKTCKDESPIVREIANELVTGTGTCASFIESRVAATDSTDTLKF